MADQRKLEAVYHEIVHLLPELESFVKLCKTSSVPYYQKIIEFQELTNKIDLVKPLANEVTQHMDHG